MKAPWFPLKSIDEAEEFYRKRYLAEYGSPRGYHYAVCLRSGNVPIGYVSVSMDDAHDFGYGLRKEFWHKGIVTEAAKAVVEEQWQPKNILVTFRMYQLNFDRNGGWVYRKYWDTSQVHFIEKGF